MIFQKSLQNSLMCIERSTNRYENYKTINNVWFFMLRAILIGIVAKNFWIYICSWWKSIGPYQGIVLTTFLLKQMSRFCFRLWHILLMMKDVYKLSNWTCSSGKIFCTLATISWSVVQLLKALFYLLFILTLTSPWEIKTDNGIVLFFQIRFLTYSYARKKILSKCKCCLMTVIKSKYNCDLFLF